MTDYKAEQKYSNDRILYKKVNKTFKDYMQTNEFEQEYNKIDKLIYDKLQPIIDQVKLEYEQSEEFKFSIINDAMKIKKKSEIEEEKKYKDTKYEKDSYFGQGYYDSHYNRDGTSKIYSEEAKAWDKSHENNQQNSSSGRDNYDYNSFFGSSTTALNLSDNEKSIAKELIKAGFKKLALQYHPDKNQGSKDSEEKMKSINLVKEKMMNAM